MIVGIVSVAVILLALGVLGVVAIGLGRRLRRLDAELSVARAQVARLNDVIAQAPRAGG